MNNEEFVRGIKLNVRDAALEDCESLLSNPPGRAPGERLLELSRWYNSLDEADKVKVYEVARQAVDLAVFGFFCVLDGVRAFDEAGGQLALYYQDGAANTRLNGNDADHLHDIFKDLVDNG